MADVVVYTKAACGWCGAVKKQLDKAGYGYREVRADLDESAMKFLMDQMAFTFPQVFVDEHRIGGYEATVEALVAGEFARLVEASPYAATGEA